MTAVQMVSYMLHVCHCYVWNDMTFELVERDIKVGFEIIGGMMVFWVTIGAILLITLMIFGLFDKVRGDICEDSVFDVTCNTSLHMLRHDL